MSLTSKPPTAKAERIKLTGAAYKRVREQVFQADEYRCKVCGRRYWLTVHHMVRRSKHRTDTLSNMLTLCARCHRLETDRNIIVEWVNVEQRTVKVTERRTAEQMEE